MSKKITFKLISGELVEWLYYGYSDFIDNLEPEPDKPVLVYESFTIEDFEFAYIEYEKFIKFNKALEDIKNKEKMWSKEELKEMSKYNLNCCVLEWLVTKESKLNKEIKEIFSLDSFSGEYIKKNKYELQDSILIYYLMDETNQNKFEMACNNGYLGVAQWLYSLGEVDINQGIVFIISCCRGHIEMAKWLYSLGGVDIHENNEYLFRILCEKGHLEMAQWLYSLGRINIHIKNEMVFIMACFGGFFELARWLYSLGVNIHAQEDLAFSMACKKGHLEMAMWLYSLDGVEIHTGYDFPFRGACSDGHLEVAQWLYSLGGVDIHIMNEYSFRESCFWGHLDVAKWLFSLGGFDKSLIKSSNSKIKEWLDTLP